MVYGKKVVVVMPAYNAAKTLTDTFNKVDREIVDSIILVDDASQDNTAELSSSLGIITLVHNKNLGYGGNQKTCYKNALKNGADIIIMLHPDYQYTPLLLPAMSYMIANGLYDVVLGSRILGIDAFKGGMPLYKYISNRILTLIQNILLGQKLSEYHTGYRAFSKEVLEALSLEKNSNNFIFDNQMLCQIFFNGFKVGEVSCPAKYFKEASSINFLSSIRYGLGCLYYACRYFIAKKLSIGISLFLAKNRSKCS